LENLAVHHCVKAFRREGQGIAFDVGLIPAYGNRLVIELAHRPSLMRAYAQRTLVPVRADPIEVRPRGMHEHGEKVWIGTNFKHASTLWELRQRPSRSAKPARGVADVALHLRRGRTFRRPAAEQLEHPVPSQVRQVDAHRTDLGSHPSRNHLAESVCEGKALNPRP